MNHSSIKSSFEPTNVQYIIDDNRAQRCGVYYVDLVLLGEMPWGTRMIRMVNTLTFLDFYYRIIVLYITKESGQSFDSNAPIQIQNGPSRAMRLVDFF